MNAPVVRHRSPSAAPPPHVVVVGGGIAGLTAAAHLGGAAGAGGVRAHVTLLESQQRLGGKLLCGEVGGVPVDLGAEALFVRRPAAVELARAVGLGPDLEPPSAVRASLWTRGTLRPMPRAQMMGIPADLDDPAVAGVLSARGLTRARRDLWLPRTEVGDDITVGRYVAARMGREVVDRLVEPLLGGVYAGQADRLSLRTTMPRLLAVAREEGSLLRAVRRLQPPVPGDSAAGTVPPPFRSIRGGLGRLPLAVAGACRSAGVDIRTGTAARAMRRTDCGWRLIVEDDRGERELDADAVVIAVPAPDAARLLAHAAPAAASELRAVAYADMALVTLVFNREDLSVEPRGSGFLVPPVDGRVIKASTFLSNKWRWLEQHAPGKAVVRVSVGRHGENTALARGDGELVAGSCAELAEATGMAAVPADTAVTRWTNGLPQYALGHATRMRRVHEQIRELGTLAVCGAVYDGVGVSSCIEGGQRASGEIEASLRGRTDHP